MREKKLFFIIASKHEKKISSCFLSQAASSKRLTINGNFQDKKREARSDHDNNCTCESYIVQINSLVLMHQESTKCQPVVEMKNKWHLAINSHCD
jgi:hypothetical protein